MKRLLVIFALPIVALVALAIGSQGASTANPADFAAYYPDLRTVVPNHLQLVNAQQHDILRFTNGIANTGNGPWAMRPDPPPALAVTTTAAVQQIRDSGAQVECGQQKKQVTACFNVLAERIAGVFEFHPAHNHWHIGKVALFEVRKGASDGPIVGNNSIKTGFCLIDWYKLEGNSPTSERTFFDCATSYQGASVGWVDQYHQELEGQSIDLTDAPDADDYYLVSTSNSERIFLEQNYDNNSAWVKFRLYGSQTGNRKIEITGHSPCDSPGLCGIGAPNR